MKLILIAVAFGVFTTSYGQNNSNSCATENHRAFDFWVGEWKVLNPKGKEAGRNQIKVEQGGCVLVENWSSADGVFKGTSYNFYNASTEKWNQTWVDNQGGSLLLEGNIQNGAMVLSGKSKGPQGQWQLDRITWTPNGDGTVRQHWQVSTDEGKSWATSFDGTYHRQ